MGTIAAALAGGAAGAVGGGIVGALIGAGFPRSERAATTAGFARATS